jgi:hypothetical protein
MHPLFGASFKAIDEIPVDKQLAPRTDVKHANSGIGIVRTLPIVGSRNAAADERSDEHSTDEMSDF